MKSRHKSIRSAVPVAVALALLVAAPVFAKDLYLTVRRDFAPTEAPTIEVNYNAGTPVSLRVYKPKDMKEFIASQIDLRRAWRQPKVETNTARYLLRGLNETKLDIDWLRAASSTKMREPLKEKFGGGSWSRKKSHLVEGPKNLILGPDKFELVQEIAIHPDDQDQDRPFDVPGFNWWFPSRGSLKTKEVALPQLASGFYLVQTVQGALEGQVVVIVNDLAAALQQSSGHGLVRVTDRSGRPVAGATVELRNVQGDWVGAAKSSAEGVAEVKSLRDTELIAVVSYKDSVAIIDTDFYPTTAVFPDLYLYTDRPMYKPGHKVFFKGIARELSSGVSRLLSLGSKEKEAFVSLTNIDSGVVGTGAAFALSGFGTFTGQLELPADLPAGVYRVDAKLQEGNHAGEFRVKDYVKPLLFTKIESTQETLKAGGTLDAKVSIQRFAGGVPSKATYRATLYRVRTESPQWVDDAGMGETGSQVTYGWDKDRESGVSVPMPVLELTDLSFDSQGKSSLHMQIPTELPGEKNYNYKFVLTVYASDSDGNPCQASRSFLDRLSEVDALARFTGVITGPDNPAKLEVRAVSPSGKSYGKTSGELTWVHTAYKGEPTPRSAVPIETDANGRYSVDVPLDKPGSLRAEVVLYDRKRNPATSEAGIVVTGAQEGESLVDVPEPQLFARRTYYFPGETSKALLLLPDGWGEGGKNSGTIFLTVAGRQIYEQRTQKVNGLSTWIVQPIKEEYGTGIYVVLSYLDTRQGWVERRLTYTIPPKDKRMTVAIKPASDVVAPGGEQMLDVTVTDHAGKPIEAELSVSVVDKAVLAVQPEFRPQLIDFFHPMERLNLMTFFSSQFQSYGYGEALAKLFKPNHWFASAKGEEEAHKEEDTAYWNGQIVTDRQGRAKATFRLPANQTIWNVSVVAVDRNGRFGEGACEFKANMPVSIALAYPNFLRLGDSAMVRVMIGNLDSKTREVRSGLVADAPLRFERDLALSAKLGPKQETSGAGLVRLSAAADKPAEFKASLEYDNQKLSFSHSLKAMPGTVEYPQSFALTGREPERVKVAAGETVKDARLWVATGFAGAVLPSLEWMVAYPFGCVEQLVSTTVPSLVVREWIEKYGSPPEEAAGSDDGFGAKMKRKWSWVVAYMKMWWNGGPVRLQPEQELVLKRALDFSEAGLSKIKSYQNSDGSYSWFPGGGQSSIPMTALVLMTVASQDTWGPMDRVNAKGALNWLSAQDFPQASPQAVLVRYVDARLNEVGYLNGAPPNVASTMSFLADYAAKATVFEKALVLLAIKGYKIEKASGMPEKVRPLLASVKQSVDALIEKSEAQPDAWSPVASSWPEYPGRLASTLALAGRAMHAYGDVTDDQRRRIGEQLLRYFNGEHFGSTFETSQALIHARWLVESEIRGRKSSMPVVLIDGKRPSGDVKATPGLGGWLVKVPPASLPAGEHAVTVDNVNDFRAASLRVVKESALDKAEPMSGGWRVTKSYFKLDPKSGRQTPIADIDKLKVGDLVYVKVDFNRQKTTRMPWWASSYYVVTDLVPAGFSVIEEDKDYTGSPYRLKLHSNAYKRREVGTDMVRWYFAFDRGWMERGDSVGYVARVNYAGDFLAGVARVENFYDETLYSQSGSRRFRVDAAAIP